MALRIAPGAMGYSLVLIQAPNRLQLGVMFLTAAPRTAPGAMGYSLVPIQGLNRLQLGVMFLMEARDTGCDCLGGAGGDGVNQRLTYRRMVHATVGLRAACVLRSARTPRIAWTSEQVGGEWLTDG